MGLRYQPYFGQTVAISATTTTGRIALLATAPYLRILNIGTVVTFVKLGDVTVTAVAADFAIAPNESVIIAKGNTYTHIAAMTASGTATVYATPVTVNS